MSVAKQMPKDRKREKRQFEVCEEKLGHVGRHSGKGLGGEGDGQNPKQHGKHRPVGWVINIYIKMTLLDSKIVRCAQRFTHAYETKDRRVAKERAVEGSEEK
mmetsp:Transcript_13724/g.27289  ORF Transcript_13724/g.27289 Transcript_13724/m.27289 type:complete len:102 (+) Transcript_13724:182-487(+)